MMRRPISEKVGKRGEKGLDSIRGCTPTPIIREDSDHCGARLTLWHTDGNRCTLEKIVQA